MFRESRCLLAGRYAQRVSEGVTFRVSSRRYVRRPVLPALWLLLELTALGGTRLAPAAHLDEVVAAILGQDRLAALASCSCERLGTVQHFAHGAAELAELHPELVAAELAEHLPAALGSGRARTRAGRLTSGSGLPWYTTRHGDVRSWLNGSLCFTFA